MRSPPTAAKSATRENLYKALKTQCSQINEINRLKKSKDRSLENGLSCIFRATGNVLTAKAIAYKGKRKETDPVWGQICSSLAHW